MGQIVLGIETSCDDTSVCILNKEANSSQVLSHLKFSQEILLKKWGGVVPEIAARNHLLKISPLIEQCLQESKVESKEIDLIGVTTVPGLLGPLLTGLNAAKSIALINKSPIIAVNHLYAHLEAIHLTEQVSYPYLGLLVSGGHTVFFLVESHENFKVLGSTIDDAAGEAFDKGGKLLGLGYPAGVIIDKLSKWGDPKKYSFPIGLQKEKTPRMSFSGLKTSLRLFSEKNAHLLEGLDLQKEGLTEEFNEEYQNLYDVCASYQHAIVESLRYKLQFALEGQDKNIPIVVGGGVACNSALRATLVKNYKNVYFVKPEFCTDNGAMIANYAAINSHKAVAFPDCLKLDARGRFIQKDGSHG